MEDKITEKVYCYDNPNIINMGYKWLMKGEGQYPFPFFVLFNLF